MTNKQCNTAYSERMRKLAKRILSECYASLGRTETLLVYSKFEAAKQEVYNVDACIDVYWHHLTPSDHIKFFRLKSRLRSAWLRLRVSNCKIANIR